MEWNMKSIAQDYRHILVMHPTLAWQLHNAGFTRRSFIQWLYDNTVIDWDSMTREQQAKTREAVAAGKFPGVTTESLKPGFFKGPFTDVRHVALIVSAQARAERSCFRPCAALPGMLRTS
jgi:hypothetical protein